MNKIKHEPFTEKCICLWSKDDEYGFIPDARCPVHGKNTREVLERGVEIKDETIKQW